ncbi:MAG: M28 family peptidase [Smithellaceae bacterium]
MRKKIMIILLIVILFLGGFLLYSLLRVRITASVYHHVTPAMRQTALYQHVRYLSVHIGSRSIYEYEKLLKTENYIYSALEKRGYKPQRQEVSYKDQFYNNVIVTLKGTEAPEETVLVGAHYDTVLGTPGADDNASSVAVLLEAAGMLKEFSPNRTIRLVFFALEEPPVFRSQYMGSAVYARQAKERGEKIVAMLCLEMLGYFSEEKSAQTYPIPVMHLFYPDRPDFIGVVGNLDSRKLAKQVARYLKKHSSIPVETLVTVSAVPGVDFSDHKSFWDEGYPAVMITDTAFYRNPNYHASTDTIDTLDFDRMKILLEGLVETIKALSDQEGTSS